MTKEPPNDEPDQAPEPIWAQTPKHVHPPALRFLGELTTTAGILLTVLSGLCTGAGLLVTVSSVVATGFSMDALSLFGSVIVFGAPPLLLGAGLMWLGRTLSR